MSNSKTRDEIPMTDAERLADESAHTEPCAGEMVIDLDFISIHRSRYDELLRAEAQLDVVRKFYGFNGVDDADSVSDMMRAVFGRRGDIVNA